MVSTYSQLLRLELIGTGDQSGVWGVTTNRNLGTLIENAISGRVVVTHTDASEIVLTTNNGVADQSRPMILSINGVLTADRDVVCPTSPKRYIVTNDTTGGFGVTLRTAAGSGVAVPPGLAFDVFCDGTNVRATETIISTASLADGAVTTVKLAADAVTAAKLAANAVETDALVAGAVTNAKLADMAAGTLKMRNSLSAGVPGDVTINSLTAVSSVDETSSILIQLSTGDFRRAPPSAIVAASSLVPPATVAPFAGAAAPTGWYLCDGTVYDKVTDEDLYAALAPIFQTSATTFTVPDLRGEFIRGFDAGRGVDAGRALGTAQTDELKSHTHGYSRGRQTTRSLDTEKVVGDIFNREAATTDATGGAETRPRNVALNYMIKR